ncbi:MAG: TadE family protein [Bryobacteraceae bacterium]
MASYPQDKSASKGPSPESTQPPVSQPKREVSERRRRRQRGSTITEFAVVIPFISIAFFGTVSFGISLGRYIQVVQVCRDVAHMYADGVDFSQSSAKALAVQLAQGTGMTAAGGNGVVVLSRVRQVYTADCTAAGYGTCPNNGQIVFTQRLTIGNTALRASSFGTPAAAILNAQGNINASVYLQNTNSTVRANSTLASLYTSAGQPAGLAQGDSAWIAEVYFTAPNISFLDFNYSSNLRSSTSGGAYARFIF